MASGLTLKEACASTGLDRDTILAMEAGEMPVGRHELERFREAYGMPVETLSWIAPPSSALIGAIFRSVSDRREREELDDSLGQQPRILYQLEDLRTFCLSETEMPPTYREPFPRSVGEAIAQGTRVARLERRRLGLGHGPIEDVQELVEGEGVDVAYNDLKGDISGIMLAQPGANPLIVVDADQEVARGPLSIARGYAHVLLDREEVGLVSRAGRRGGVLEARAAAFATEFLLPERGIRTSLAATAGRRRGPRSAWRRRIEPSDVADLANRHRVDRMVALRRIRGMRLLDATSMDALHEGTMRLPGRPVSCRATNQDRFALRYVGLAERAYMSGCISTRKLIEVLALVFGQDEAEAMVRGPDGIEKKTERHESLDAVSG